MAAAYTVFSCLLDDMTTSQRGATYQALMHHLLASCEPDYSQCDLIAILNNTKHIWDFSTVKSIMKDVKIEHVEQVSGN